MTGGVDGFDDYVSKFDYPMLIVTVAAEGKTAGCLVGFSSQCSISPARFVVFISDKNYTYRVAAEAQRMAVHLVPEDGEEIARLFGERSGDDVDKFQACDWAPEEDGTPILDGCPSHFVGRIVERIPVGDHAGYFLEPETVETGNEEGFFPFKVARDFTPGHEA